VYKLARSRLPAALEAKLATFPSTIVEVHGKDVYIGGTASGTSTPPVVSAPSTSGSASTASAAPAKAAPAPVKKTSKAGNTSTITVEASFQASADDLFSLLTDEKRIPAWTRNSAVVCHQRFFINVNCAAN
jgi:activator of HSP90 ATPase